MRDARVLGLLRLQRGAIGRGAQAGKAACARGRRPPSSAAKMTMAKKTGGPLFLRFVAPVVDTLKALGGSGTRGEVIDGIIDRLQLSEDARAATTKGGKSRVLDQIAWARFYLRHAGMIDGSQRGVWTLTQKGAQARLDDQAVGRLFERVREQFKRVADDADGAGPLPEDEEESLSSGDASIAASGPGEPGVEEETEDEGSDRIHVPYEASKTHIVTKPMSVEQLAKRLRYGEIVAPEFQRKADLWNDEKKSRLIESMLIRIPLPVFYFDATDEARWLVVDGLQRLSTIRHFMVEADPRVRLRLKGLEYLVQHEGRTFDELPRDLQRRIEETQIFAHLIQPGTPAEVKYNIFKRINTGGLVLTAQEIRHALYQKDNGAPQLLNQLAESPEFIEATDGAIERERMLDREFVLRFVSFSLTPYGRYEANMETFLNRHMQRLNDDGEGPARDDLRRRFRQAMAAAQQVFGKDAFRKLVPGERRKPINKALFEAWSVALGNLDGRSLERLLKRKDVAKRAFVAVLAEDSEFEAAITQGTGEVKRVRKRFSTIEDILRRTLSQEPSAAVREPASPRVISERSTRAPKAWTTRRRVAP
jgi:Mrr N-terminal domain/Protein of unknown function DUF262